MTYRERRAARVARLRGWADGREAKADAAAAAMESATAGIPFGQPILVGHHSERAHRRALERSDRAVNAAVEHSVKARSMRSRADNIEASAAAAVYDDDPDAIDRLREKLAALEQRREAMKAANAAYRKAHRAELQALPSAFQRDRAVPHPSYELQNLGGTISRTRQRLARLEAA